MPQEFLDGGYRNALVNQQSSTRTKYYETIRLGASFSIGAPTNEFVYVSHNDGEMMVYIDSTGIVTKIFSSADEIISISLKDNQIMITAIYYDLIVTISVLSF